MLVKFNNQLHFVLNSYNVVQPKVTTETKKTKKRKQPEPEMNEVYFVINCTNNYTMRRDFVVNAKDCVKVDAKIPSNFNRALCAFLERKLLGNGSDKYRMCLRINYNDKEYDIHVISEIKEDGLIVELSDGEIRHFKFNKIEMDSIFGGVILDDDDHW